MSTTGAGADRDAHAAGGPLRTILAGLGWNTSSQVATTALNVVATPLLLVKLGVDAYGVYALVSSFRGLLSNLDGGLGPCASRYLAVYAGAGDRRAMSSFVATAALMAAVVVTPVVALVFLFAPDLVVVLHASPRLRGEATTLVRLFMPLLLVTTVRAMATRTISAEHRWRYLAAMNTASMAVYLVLGVGLAFAGKGVIGLFWASVAQEAVLAVATVAGVRRSLEARHLRLVGRQEIREIVRYASRVQVAEIASSFGNEVNALVVGLIFPVRFVTYYSVGTNFATQLVGLPVNALGPIAITLSRTFGVAGLRRTIDELASLQRMWVRATSAWAPIGAVAAWFGVVAWLGPKEHLAAVVASILLVGQAPWMLAMVMDGFCKAVNRPGLESRYLALATAIDVGLAVPLALSIGMLGVPAGVAAGNVVGSVYLLRLARRSIDVDLRSFFADVPLLPVALGVGVTLALELPLAPLAPRGALGLALCGVPAAAGLAAYALALAGPAASLELVRRALAGRRAPVPVPAGPPPLAPGEHPRVEPQAALALGPAGVAAPAPPPATPALGEPARLETLAGYLDDLLERARATGPGGVVALVVLQLHPVGGRGQPVAGEELEDVAVAVVDAVRDGDVVVSLGRDALAVGVQVDAGAWRLPRSDGEPDGTSIARRIVAAATTRHPRDVGVRVATVAVEADTGSTTGDGLVRAVASRIAKMSTDHDTTAQRRQ